MKRLFFYTIAIAISILAMQCESGPRSGKGGVVSSIDSPSQKSNSDTVVVFLGTNSKGVGRFDDVHLTHPLDETMVVKGKAIFESKCFACHKLTQEMLVGPGWAGVTNRRTPEWIMNWITNTKVMLSKDLAAQADLAVCLIRMPNQDLTDDQARNVLEFMRRNDGKK